jgi:fatty acid desaturase
MNSKIEWVIPEVSRECKTLFHQQSNKIAALDLAMRITLHLIIFCCLVVALDLEVHLLFVAFVVANGILISFLGWAGAGHEYFHGTAFKNRRLNRVLFRLFSCATWNNWGWFEVSHQLHHKYTLHLLDPESPKKRSRSTPSRLFWLVTIDFPVFIRRLQILFLNSSGVVPGLNQPLRDVILVKPRFSRRIRIGALSVFGYQALVFLIIFQIDPFLAVVIALAPFTFNLVNKIVETNQHLGMKYHAKDFRENSRTIRFGSLIEFLYSNMNFHSEHHMFPGVPYYRLPEINAHLVKLRLVEIPRKGFYVATKIAIETGLDPTNPKDCLNCFVKCPSSSDPTMSVE